jgi:DNA-binding transcriptional ArsR family regulator
MTTNTSILPRDDSVTTDPSPELVALEDAGDVIDALASNTARVLLERIYESPATASELGATTDTSLQNVQYHLGRLVEVELIEVVDTWYSEKGREIAVYGAKHDPMVIFAGRANRTPDIERVVSTWH